MIARDTHWSGKWLRIVLLVTLYAALVWLGNVGGVWLVHQLGFDPSQDHTLVNLSAIWTGLLAYAVLLAIPFVPGMEISLALFAMFGSAVAVPIYFATVAALLGAYLVGRSVPTRLVSSLFRTVGLNRAEQFVQKLEPLDAEAKLAQLMSAAPRRFAPFLIRHRYIAVAVAFNLPGNAILGGGGGIALLAGLSGLFSLPGYLLAVCLAVLPIPVAAFLGGKLF